MRPLADLTPLDTQPTVWDQSTDDWNGIFANEFAGIDSQQAAADGESPGLFAGMDPISSAIDGLSSALDLAGSVMDLLSGDLDAVNLDPIITEYQGYDSALDSGLNNFAIDQGSILNGFLSDLQPLWQAVLYVVQEVINGLLALLAQLYQLIMLAFAAIGIAGNGPGPPEYNAPISPLGV